MTQSGVKHALIIDEKPKRAETFMTALREYKITCDHRKSIVAINGRGCKKEYLETVSLPPSGILFIHMGPLSGDRAQDPDKDYGNQCSLEWYVENIRTLQSWCVIAYTAGAGSEPEEFKTLKRRGWHRYFRGITGADAFNVGAFVSNWKMAPEEPPPFDLLVNWSDFVAAFRVLVAGFQVANKGGVKSPGGRDVGAAPMELEGAPISWTHQMSWWRPILGHDGKGTQLLDELKSIGALELLSVAEAIVKWLASMPRDESSSPAGKSLTLDEPLVMEILAVKLWLSQ